MMQTSSLAYRSDDGQDQFDELSESGAPPKAELPAWPQHVFSFGVSLALIGVLGGRLSWWTSDGPVVLPAARYAAAIAVLLFMPALYYCIRLRRLPRLTAQGFAGGLVPIFYFDWLTHDYALLKGPSIRGEILLGSAAAFYALRRNWRAAAAALLPLSSLLLFLCFYSGTGGKLLLGDDHAVFLHRLSLLKQGFPRIPVYDSLWNAGLDSLHLFATGVLNVFFLHLPLVYFFPLERVYSFIVADTLFFILPLAAYAAARLHRLGPAVAALSAVLAISQSLLLYRWGLSYGAMGFVTALALLPLTFALAARMLEGCGEFGLKEGAAAAISFSLMLCWPLSGIVFVPAAVMALFSIRRIISSKSTIAAAAAAALITLPWVYLLWSGWKVPDFLAGGSTPALHAEAEEALKHDGTGPPAGSEPAAAEVQEFKGHVFRVHKGELSLVKGLKAARSAALSANPLLLLFSLPGIMIFSRRRRVLFAATLIWLAALAVIGGPLKPQLELNRMLLLAGAICCPAAAAGLAALFRSASCSRYSLAAGAAAGGFLFAGVFGAASAAQNKSVERYYTWTPTWQNMVEHLVRLPGDGRVLFSGFVLHDIDNSHLAPLTHFVPRPMVASSHVHNVWQYTELVPPPYMRRGEVGIEEYFDLQNASAVVAHQPFWKEYLSARPERYRSYGQAGAFQFFERRGPSAGYFLSGSGKVHSQDTTGVELELNEPDAVIRYSYSSSLQVKGCRIEPAPLYGKQAFIRLSDCPTGVPLRLESRSFLDRLLRPR